jgi:hypothetical protein
MLCKTRPSYDIMLANGIGTRQERTTLIDCSPISIVTGLNANGTKVEKESILFIQCVIHLFVSISSLCESIR